MKMRFRIVAEMLTMALLFTMVGTAYAAYQKQATLNYQGIKITLNGEEITPKDGAGNIVEPFIIDGTTYLPVRAVSGALGLNVDWDGSTNTVILTSPTDVKDSGLDKETVSYAWRISQYAELVHLVCDRAAQYASNGSGSAAEVQDISTAFYDKALPVLDTLREDIKNDQMYDLYMAAYDLTGTAEELIYRYAQLEAGTSKTAGKEFSIYSEQEMNKYFDILDSIGSILSPEK